MDIQKIKQVLDSEAGQELKSYLRDACEELRDIAEVPEKDSIQAQLIEYKSRKEAFRKLKQIFSQLEIWEETRPSRSGRLPQDRLY